MRKLDPLQIIEKPKSQLIAASSCIFFFVYMNINGKPPLHFVSSLPVQIVKLVNAKKKKPIGHQGHRSYVYFIGMAFE